MKIGIVGNGVVGNATARAFAGYDVRCYDAQPSRCTHALGDVLESDIVFVCLPTPQRINSLACNLDYIHQFFANVRHRASFEYGYSQRVNYVLRSTVPIGTTKMLREKYNLPNLVHSPEFLTARTAVEDACNPTRLVIGTDGPIPIGCDDSCACMLYDLYEEVFGGAGMECMPRIFVMSSNESEAVKLIQNGFSAVKIAFFNEMRTLCDAHKMDWNRVLQTVLAGGWICPMHTQVPGPDGKRGFGGACLPKDLASLVSCLRDFELRNDVCSGAYNRNKEDRTR